MRVIFFCVIVLLFFSCTNNNVSSKKFAGYKKIQLSFINASIKIPNNYVKMTPNKLKSIFLNSNEKKEYIEQNINALDKIKKLPNKHLIYLDKENLQNQIWFIEGEFVPLNKKLAQQYLGMVEQQLKKDWLPKGIDYYRVENKITLRSKSQIIKLKYWLYQDNFKRYCTQYLISTKNKTFGIFVNNSKDIDFKDILETVKFN